MLVLEAGDLVRMKGDLIGDGKQFCDQIVIVKEVNVTEDAFGIGPSSNLLWFTYKDMEELVVDVNELPDEIRDKMDFLSGIS